MVDKTYTATEIVDKINKVKEMFGKEKSTTCLNILAMELKLYG